VFVITVLVLTTVIKTVFSGKNAMMTHNEFVRKHSQKKDKYEIILMQFLLHSNHLLYTLSLCVSKQTSYSMAHDEDGGLSPNHKNLIAAIGIGAVTVTGSKLIELALVNGIDASSFVPFPLKPKPKKEEGLVSNSTSLSSCLVILLN
jgi:hypothetical protein